MTSMLLAGVLQLAVIGTGVEATPVAIADGGYEEARLATTETGKPLVVMIGTDWCPPCQTMKKTVMPRVREGGLLRKVAFALVNPDREHELAEKLTGGGPIPQLVMFRKKGNGWVRKKLVGGQSVEAVERFIKEGVDGEKDVQKSLPASNDQNDKNSDPATHHRSRDT